MEGKNHAHYGHRSRLRDRARNEGLENFQNYQVLEYALSFVIPYKDTNPLAHELINKFGSLSGVLEAREEDLMEVKGMGEASAHFLTSLIQIFGCYQREKCSKTGFLNNPTLTYEHIKGCFVGKVVEEAYLISLLPNNKVSKTEKLGEGTISNVRIAIRKITDAVSRNRVNKIVLAHNHPSGTCNPSIDDDNFTKALMTTLAINDCELVDHMIVGQKEGEFYSYRRAGRIDLFAKDVRKMMEGIQEKPNVENNLTTADNNASDDYTNGSVDNTNTSNTRKYTYENSYLNDDDKAKIEELMNKTYTFDFDDYDVTSNSNIIKNRRLAQPDNQDPYSIDLSTNNCDKNKINNNAKNNGNNIVEELKWMAGMTGDKNNDKK